MASWHCFSKKRSYAGASPIFSVDSVTGQVVVAKTNASLLLPVGRVFCLGVSVADRSGLSAAAPASVCVTIVISNDPPVIGPLAFSIAENAAAGAGVGAVIATDAYGYALTYSILLGNVNNAFSINAATASGCET